MGQRKRADLPRRSDASNLITLIVGASCSVPEVAIGPCRHTHRKVLGIRQRKLGHPSLRSHAHYLACWWGRRYLLAGRRVLVDEDRKPQIAIRSRRDSLRVLLMGREWELGNPSCWCHPPNFERFSEPEV